VSACALVSSEECLVTHENFDISIVVFLLFVEEENKECNVLHLFC
jgi:hypothetical protein